MGEQLELMKKENLETKSDVFYTRCRPNVKKVMLMKMQQDGFTSMADWFDQFVNKVVSPLVTRKPKKKAKKK